MGVFRTCFCSLVFIAASFTIGACSGGDNGSSSLTCHCEWGEGSCDEFSSGDCRCAYETCTVGTDSGSDGCMTIRGEEGAGSCSQTDVVGSCFCETDNLTIYYRSTFPDDQQDDCENYYFDCVYTAR